MVEDYVFGLGIGIGYYVIVLLQYVALVPLLARLRGTAQHVAVMAITTLVGLAATYSMQSAFSEAWWARFPYYCLPFIAWAPFFHLGFWSGRNPDAIKPRSDARWLCLATLAVLVAIAEGFYWDGLGLSGLATSQIKASSFLASVFVALHVIASRETHRVGLLAASLEWIGRSSYMIYLSHMLLLPQVTSAVRLLLPDLYSIRPAALLLATALTVAGCVMVALLLRKATRPTIHRDLLGAG